MNGLQNIRSVLTNPAFWQAALGASCLISSIALLVIGIQSVHFEHLAYLHSYNTLATFDLVKTAGSLIGAGALAGTGIFVFKKIAMDKIHSKLMKNQKENMLLDKAIRGVRALYPVFSIMSIVAGALLITFALFYILHLPNQPTVIPHIHMYLANEQLLKTCLAGFVIAGFLVSLGILDAARSLSNSSNKSLSI